jgi:hypothetical protein
LQKTFQIFTAKPMVKAQIYKQMVIH